MSFASIDGEQWALLARSKSDMYSYLNCAWWGRLVLLGALCLSIGACRSEPSDVAHASTLERKATLFFTTGLSGYIEPCGCTSEPLGGLARLATVIKNAGQQSALVDAGQLLLPVDGLDELTRPQHVAKAKLLARAFRRLGGVALNLAPPDLIEGIDFLSELQREGAVPLVSANIRPRSEDGPRVARSRLQVIGGIRFGFTGLAIPEAVASVSKEVAALEIAPAVRTEVQALRKDGAEVIVVMAHAPEAEARVLAQAIPEMDVLLRSPGTPIEGVPNPPFRVGSVVIAEAGTQGQYVGQIKVWLGAKPPKEPLALDDGGAKLVSDRGRLQRRIKALQMEIDRFALDPATKEASLAREQIKKQLETRLSQMSADTSEVTGPRMEMSLLPIVQSIAEDRAISNFLAAYRQELRAVNLTRGDPKACEVEGEDQPIYVGTETCAKCHQPAYEFWKGTAHARAWETLERDAKHYDFTCVGCHSVGFREPGGFCVLADAKKYEDVGCENCHGPGSRHAQAPVSGSINRAENSTTCQNKCHVPEHSDTFVYETYVRKITGEGHPLSAEK